MPACAAGLDDLLAHEAGRRGHGDDDLVHVDLAQHARQVGAGAAHPGALDAQAALARVVVDQADRRVAQLAVALHLAQQRVAGVPGAADQHLAAAAHQLGARRALDDAAHREARAADERQREHEVEDQHPARHRHQVVGAPLRQDGRDQQARGRRGEHDRLQVAQAREAPPLGVEAHRDEGDDLDRHDDRERRGEESLVAPGDVSVEPEVEGQPEGGGDEPRVDRDLSTAVGERPGAPVEWSATHESGSLDMAGARIRSTRISGSRKGGGVPRVRRSSTRSSGRVRRRRRPSAIRLRSTAPRRAANGV